MRRFLGLIVCLLLLVGCGPAVSKEDLGTVLDDVPEIPAAEKPYEMPELNRPAAAEPQSVESPATP